ncbi:MAG: AMP-binding protein [Gammaproteobacteria bacterium]|nr:AMP-binding protein [Gammaproteobacteria bacterium]
MSDDDKILLIAGERSLSKAQLFQQGAVVARKLGDAGLKHGDAIALILRNDFAYFVMHDAARYGNFDIVPVNWHLKVPEIDYILQDCSAKAVIIHADLLTDDLQITLVDHLVVVVPEAGASLSSWAEWISSTEKPEQEAVPFCPPLFYTSGTSGKPKAVVREKISPKLIVKIAERTCFAWGFDKLPIRSVMTGPLYHSAPNGYANMVLQADGLLVLQEKFDAEELLMLIEKHEITHLHMVPTMFSRLLALPAEIRSKYSLTSLLHVSHGAAPCPPEVKRQMIEWWGSVIHEYYAMTETGIICCSNSEEWLAHPGSVGCAAPGVSLQIRHDDGSECATGEAGFICVQHEATAAVSYHNAADKSADLVQDGFLVTGDIGYLDENGFCIFPIVNPTWLSRVALISTRQKLKTNSSQCPV